MRSLRTRRLLRMVLVVRVLARNKMRTREMRAVICQVLESRRARLGVARPPAITTLRLTGRSPCLCGLRIYESLAADDSPHSVANRSQVFDIPTLAP